MTLGQFRNYCRRVDQLLRGTRDSGVVYQPGRDRLSYSDYRDHTHVLAWDAEEEGLVYTRHLFAHWWTRASIDAAPQSQEHPLWILCERVTGTRALLAWEANLGLTVARDMGLELLLES